MKRQKADKGQSIMEYFIILTVLLTAVLTTGFIDRVRDTFSNYLAEASAVIATDWE